MAYAIRELMILTLLGGLWVGIGATWLAGIVRHLLLHRRIERVYRVRLARWRAAADSA